MSFLNSHTKLGHVMLQLERQRSTGQMELPGVPYPYKDGEHIILWALKEGQCVLSLTAGCGICQAPLSPSPPQNSHLSAEYKQGLGVLLGEGKASEAEDSCNKLINLRLSLLVGHPSSCSDTDKKMAATVEDGTAEMAQWTSYLL